MLKTTDLNEIDKYMNEMYEIKKKNRDDFFRMSSKRKIVKYFLKNKFSSKLLRNIVPYSYNKIEKDINYFSNNRIAIYTAIYGSYDCIYEPKSMPDNCDFYIFTDSNVNSKRWNIVNYDFNHKKFTDIEKNRFIKMHPHLLFPEYSYSIYVDGNIEICTDFTEFIDDMNIYGLKLHKHFKRNCVYLEIEECKNQHKCPITELEDYKDYLEKNGMPKNYGLLEAPIIVREHNNGKCINLMNQWWNEFINNVHRDQLSLIYILWKNNILVKDVGTLGEDINANYSFIQHEHKQSV